MTTSYFKSVLIAAACLASFGAQASLITYSFTASGAHAGTFTYDNTATSIGNGPYAPGGVAYSAVSFIVDGVSWGFPELVIYPNFFGNQLAYFTTLSGSDDLVQFTNTGLGLFSGSAASVMDGRTLSDFDGLGGGSNLLFIGGIGQHFRILSLAQTGSTRVPEPATLGLLGLGLAGVGFARRKRKT